MAVQAIGLFCEGIDLIARRLVTQTEGLGQLASDRHFSDSIEVDISSMRQLVTEAPELGFCVIDISHKAVQDKRKATDHSSKKRAYYWQHLVIRQAWRVTGFIFCTKRLSGLAD